MFQPGGSEEAVWSGVQQGHAIAHGLIALKFRLPKIYNNVNEHKSHRETKTSEGSTTWTSRALFLV